MRSLHPTRLNSIAIHVIGVDVSEKIVRSAERGPDEVIAVFPNDQLAQSIRCLAPDRVALPAAARGRAPPDIFCIHNRDAHTLFRKSKRGATAGKPAANNQHVNVQRRL